jgi:hypothetical protein
MRDRTAQTEPLTVGQRIVAKWEGLNGWTEPADLAEGIDEAIAAARSAALEEAAKVAVAQYSAIDDDPDGYIERIAAAIRALKT